MPGKYLEKKKRPLFPVLLLLGAAILVVGVMIGVFIGGRPDTPADSAAEQTNSAVEYIVISTDYGDLYYPEQWNDYLVTEQERVGESLTVSFFAHLNDVEYPMFQVTIGNSDDVEVGELTDSSGTKRTVYMRVVEIEESDELTESEQQRLYAMQEDLNYLIDNLK